MIPRNRIWIGILIAAVTLLAATSLVIGTRVWKEHSRRTRQDQLRQLAETSLAEKDYDGAIKAISTLQNRNPKDPEINREYLRVRTLAKNGKEEQLLLELQTLSKSDSIGRAQVLRSLRQLRPKNDEYRAQHDKALAAIREQRRKKGPTQSTRPVLLDVPCLVGKSVEEVASLLGPAQSTRSEPKNIGSSEMLLIKTYRNESTEVWYHNGIVAAIQYKFSSSDGAPFRAASLAYLGLKAGTPTFANRHVIRWERLRRFHAIHMFPIGPRGIDYVWIQVIDLD